MSKIKPLREFIATEIEKRYSRFDKLATESKALDKEKDRVKLDRIYKRLKDMVLDLECLENYVLNKHPEVTTLWHSLKDLTCE